MNELSNSSQTQAVSDEQDRADTARLATGHDAALNDLMDRHAPRLFNYLLRNLQNEDDAADLTQETFIRVHQHRKRFDSRQRFSVWLYAIASNLVRTQFRSRSRHPTVSLDALANQGSSAPALQSSGAPSPSETLQTAEAADGVRRAIADLPEELRTPLILFEYEDLSHSEIGSILDCSSKAVETRIYRARKQLREILTGFLA
jgi:RNA polymerase sigma-70 factor (ECF subfamily)